MNPKHLARKVLPKKGIKLAEESYRKSRLASVHVRYGLPAKGLKIIAVTGTNGKTSTCNFLNDILKFAGLRTAMFTTAVVEMDGQRSANTTHRTVPLTSDLFRFLKDAKTKKVDWVILETTAHALQQHKMWGIPIEIAVMTNLTQDHLDYFGTMQKYAEAKAKLFGKYMNPKFSILNTDDEWFEFYKKASISPIYTYGKDQRADLRINSIKETSEGLGLVFETKDCKINAQAPVIGEFNAYNIAAAVAVSMRLEISPDVIRKAIAEIGSVPGRMELVRSSKGFTAVIDYAVTPDALEKALKALKSIAKGKVSVIFGATGDRDKLKRPIMGEVAVQNADRIYLTDDETYTENGDQIRKEVMAGILKAGGENKTVEIADRYEAIKKAVQEAKNGDMILVAGLGHQDYRAMNEGHMPWQEVEVVKTILEETGKK
ncbi:UDP-N-acetylmuramoyl-L-alanyl-D-glutamate--2,6-diaminopimelate ligase [Candidatus Saccharibacteria bacterium]|nr:UDP-N-acetylmuramoyl-L-alanyl-D-glutamate--2,6-diaminopimelate ligase [Candidatus Saccharibacteria bacterium]